LGQLFYSCLLFTFQQGGEVFVKLASHQKYY